MNTYAIYLRKSRADVEAEARGEGETLARHRRALTQLAESRGYAVDRVYEEIVSGDSIASRPQMQALLAAVESGAYAGVIVNDADRLARGDSIDQGIVKQAFFATGTLIITPYKIYNPSSDADEDFFDFGLFMARFEYRKIKQRMQTGRLRSAAEGNFIGTRVSYGYSRVQKSDRSGWTLAPDPDKAEIVRMIYRLYADGENGSSFGAGQIATRLNQMGLRTDFGNPFDANYVRNILQNPTYIGTISWNKKVQRVRIVNGAKTIVREKNPDPIIVENACPPIIDRALFDRVQTMFAMHAKPAKNYGSVVTNPLCGLVVCSICGKRMMQHKSKNMPTYLRCVTPGCATVRCKLSIVEDAVLDALRSWTVDYAAPESAPESSPDTSPQRRMIEQTISTVNRQLDALHDLVEQGIYTPSEYVRRREDLSSRLDDARAQLAALDVTPSISDLVRAELPQIRSVLDAYPLAQTAEQKNLLLKSCVSKILYDKTKHCYRNDNPADYLTLTLYPVTSPKK